MLLRQRENISLCRRSSETGTDFTTRVHPAAFNTTKSNKRLKDKSLWRETQRHLKTECREDG